MARKARKKKFKFGINDKVRVSIGDDRSPIEGRTGKVVGVDELKPPRYMVRMDHFPNAANPLTADLFSRDPDDKRRDLWFEERQLEADVGSPAFDLV